MDQLPNWYTMPLRVMVGLFTTVLDTEGKEVLGWRWNFERPLILKNIIMTSMTVVRWTRSIWEQIGTRIELWYLGNFAGLSGGNNYQKGRVECTEDNKDNMAWKFHSMVQ